MTFWQEYKQNMFKTGIPHAFIVMHASALSYLIAHRISTGVIPVITTKYALTWIAGFFPTYFIVSAIQLYLNRKYKHLDE